MFAALGDRVCPHEQMPGDEGTPPDPSPSRLPSSARQPSGSTTQRFTERTSRPLRTVSSLTQSSDAWFLSSCRIRLPPSADWPDAAHRWDHGASRAQLENLAGIHVALPLRMAVTTLLRDIFVGRGEYRNGAGAAPGIHGSQHDIASAALRAAHWRFP